MAIKKQYPIQIFGIVYKDQPQNIQAFLQRMGNPYSRIGNDDGGTVAMDLGVYGTPESFIVDKKGTIVYRYVGMLNLQVWKEELWPLIQGLE